MTSESEAASKNVLENNQATIPKRPLDWASLLIWLALVVIIGVSAYAISQRPATTTIVWAPVRDLPAYHLITTADVITKTVAVSAAPVKPVSASDALDLRYTRQPLAVGQVIQESQLLPAASRELVSDTALVSLPATPAMAFNGRLAAGTIVTVWTVTNTGQAQPLLNEALVLDVQKVEGQSESEENAFPYVVVLAVPRPKQAELLTAMATGSLMFTLTP